MATNKVEKSGKKKKSAEAQAGPKQKFQISQIKEFTAEVKSEFVKIAWPDKKHTIASTGVVTVLVTIISFYLGAVDLLLGKLIGIILQ